jgi:hypothetical protein
MMTKITAAHLVEQLKAAGYVVMRKPSAPRHEAPPKWRMGPRRDRLGNLPCHASGTLPDFREQTEPNDLRCRVGNSRLIIRTFSTCSGIYVT